MMSTKEDQVVVDKSSVDLFAEFSSDEILSFESKLQENRMFSLTHPVGKRIFEIIQNWNNFVSFEDITYYHARELEEKDKDKKMYPDEEMMMIPMNMSSHGRYNEIGISCYYISESKEGALKEILKHRKEKEPRIQVIGLRIVESAKLLDLSGKTNMFISHLRLPAQNTGKITKEYLLPNFVAACCREVGIEGIRYQSTGYKCCVLWRDDYFEIIEGSQEVVPWSKLQAIDTSKNDGQNPFVPQKQLSA